MGPEGIGLAQHMYLARIYTLYTVHLHAVHLAAKLNLDPDALYVAEYARKKSNRILVPLPLCLAKRRLNEYGTVRYGGNVKYNPCMHVASVVSLTAEKGS